jgi:hypothetical protein
MFKIELKDAKVLNFVECISLERMFLTERTNKKQGYKIFIIMAEGKNSNLRFCY